MANSNVEEIKDLNNEMNKEINKTIKKIIDISNDTIKELNKILNITDPFKEFSEFLETDDNAIKKIDQEIAELLEELFELTNQDFLWQSSIKSTIPTSQTVSNVINSTPTEDTEANNLPKLLLSLIVYILTVKLQTKGNVY